jgi:flagellar FliL protein
MLQGGAGPSEGAHAKAGAAEEGGHGGGGGGGHGASAEADAKGAQGAKGASGAVQLEPFILNLADPEGDRFLRVSLSVVFDGHVVPSAAEQVRLRDRILTILSSKTADEVTSFEGKEALRRELEGAIARTFEGSEVDELFFTEFLVQ